MGQYQIKQSLTKLLETVGVVSLNYPNVDSVDKNLTASGDVTFIFNKPEAATIGIGGEDEHDGFIQVLLKFPLGEGDGAIMEAADEFRKVFWAGASQVTDNVQVTITSCGMGNFDELAGKYVCPLSIYWYARTRRPS